MYKSDDDGEGEREREMTRERWWVCSGNICLARGNVWMRILRRLIRETRPVLK